MKRISIYFALFTASLSAIAQDTVPNPGFEVWPFHPNYERLETWNTLNPLTYLLNKITAFKTTDSSEVRSGNYAIKLVSKFITPTDFGPAVVTTGSISPSGISGGIPINSRPAALTGWYMYSPVGNDNALLEVFLYDQGVQIGGGALRPGDSTNQWTFFTVPISYTSSDTPDVISISLFASEGGNSPPAMENSTLFLDDLAYDYATGIEYPGNQNPLKVFPNPASQEITIESDEKNMDFFIIHTLDGKKMREIKATGPLTRIKVDDLDPGKYILSAFKDEKMMQSVSFDIQR